MTLDGKFKTQVIVANKNGGSTPEQTRMEDLLINRLSITVIACMSINIGKVTLKKINMRRKMMQNMSPED